MWFGLVPFGTKCKVCKVFDAHNARYAISWYTHMYREYTSSQVTYTRQCLRSPLPPKAALRVGNGKLNHPQGWQCRTLGRSLDRSGWPFRDLFDHNSDGRTGNHDFHLIYLVLTANVVIFLGSVDMWNSH